MKNFLTSDTHWNHANIIRYSKRPFLQDGDLTPSGEWASDFHKRAAVRRMDEKLESNWNSVVTKDDDVYHLGDIYFGRTDKLIALLHRLNFRKLYFIWGNHDSAMNDVRSVLHFYPELKDRIVFLGGIAEIEIQNQRIVLCHYAMRVWNKSHRNAWHLYGHSHGSLESEAWGKSFDVGVDCHNYYPITFEQVKAIMDTRIFKQVDHHSGNKKEEGSEFTLRENL